jgi:hypothetical protein
VSRCCEKLVAEGWMTVRVHGGRGTSAVGSCYRATAREDVTVDISVCVCVYVYVYVRVCARATVYCKV